MSCAAYSTIEDAWGTKKFRRRDKPSKQKCDSMIEHSIPLSRHVSEPILNMDDLICDLYDCTYSVDNTTISNTGATNRYSETFQNLQDSKSTAYTEPKHVADIQNKSVAHANKSTDSHCSLHYTSKDTYDVFRYIFSGIILLFALEQFIQIGTYIGNRSGSANGKSI